MQHQANSVLTLWFSVEGCCSTHPQRTSRCRSSPIPWGASSQLPPFPVIVIISSTHKPVSAAGLGLSKTKELLALCSSLLAVPIEDALKDDRGERLMRIGNRW